MGMGKRMNEKLQKIIDEAGLIEDNGQVRYALSDEFNSRLVDMLLTECVKELQMANIAHCCGTTYDMGIALAAQEKMLKHLTTTFDMPEYSSIVPKYKVEDRPGIKLTPRRWY